MEYSKLEKSNMTNRFQQDCCITAQDTTSFTARLFVSGAFVTFNHDVFLSMTHKLKSKSMTPQVAYDLNPEPQLYPTYSQAVLQLRPFLFLHLKQRKRK
jgi:hypothetical protein